MTFDYLNFAAVASRQIDDKGRSVGVTYKTDGTYNAASDTLSGDTTSTVTVRCLFIEYQQTQIDGSAIRDGDKMVLIAALGNTKPRTGDIIDDGQKYTVINVKEVKPGDTVVLYKVQVRS